MSTVITEISPEPPTSSLAAPPQGLDQVFPHPAVGSLAGHSPVVRATSVQGIFNTTFSGEEVPPIYLSSPLPGATTALVGKSTVTTEVSPEPPMPRVRAPSRPVNAIPDTTQPVIADPVDRDTVVGRMWIMRELMRTAILDPALANLCNMLFNALVDGEMERSCYIVFMSGILFFVRKYFFS